MRTRDKLLIGLAAGGAALWGTRALIRSRRKIDLEGRVVVITGASTGFGLVLARQAAEAGAILVVAARGERELQAAAELLRREGARDVVAVPTDVSDQRQAEALIARAIDRFGRIDVLVNNAGTMLVGPVETMTVQDFHSVMDTNFWGQVYPTLAALPHLKAQGFGRIGNVISVGGVVAVPHMLAYTASKFAYAGFSQGLRAELAKDNILTTSVYPGTMRTGGHTHAFFKGDSQAEYTWFALSDILPGMATSADKAASKLWDAVLHGDPEVVIGWNAMLAIAVHNLAPGWTAEIMSLVNRTLPAATDSRRPAIKGEQVPGTVPGWLSRMVPTQTRPGNA